MYLYFSKKYFLHAGVLDLPHGLREECGIVQGQRRGGVRTGSKCAHGRGGDLLIEVAVCVLLQLS